MNSKAPVGCIKSVWTPEATTLMTGRVEGKDPEPVTWTFGYKGGRVFSTSLGHWDDWKIDAFRTMMIRAVFWTMNKPIPAERRRRKRSGQLKSVNLAAAVSAMAVAHFPVADRVSFAFDQQRLAGRTMG